MYEDIHYKKNFISEVICRLDFATPIDYLNSSIPKEVFDAMRDQSFPIAEPCNVIGGDLRIDSVGCLTVNQATVKQWRFWSKNRKNNCTIERTDVCFSIHDYDNYEDLRTHIIAILNSINKKFPESQGKRYGLRYINKIPADKYREWIAPKYVKQFSGKDQDHTTQYIVSKENMVNDDGLMVRLKYGFDNQSHSSPMNKDEEFLIDIDAYMLGVIFLDNIEEMTDDMHSFVQDNFEKLITDSYRNENRNNN